MKISKLFHWLYAFIMLMPVFFIAGRVAYVTFNKNAKDSYSEKLVSQTITLTDGNINDYYIQDNIVTLYLNKDYGTSSNTYGFSKISLDLNDLLNTTNVIYKGFSLYTSSVNFIHFYDSEGVRYTLNNYRNYFTSFTYVIDKSTYSSNFSLTRGTLVTNIFVTQSLDNAFEYSVNQLNEVPIFSWAQTSFLVAPFSYITGLFGIASTSPVNTLLSYWLSISIIWLVFDLVMYLPLLIHRWLDKGVLE